MSARRITLPLHYWAEQLERIYANQIHYPLCQAFRNEERYLLKEFYKVVKIEREEIRKETDRYLSSYQSGGAGLPVPRKD